MAAARAFQGSASHSGSKAREVISSMYQPAAASMYEVKTAGEITPQKDPRSSERDQIELRQMPGFYPIGNLSICC